MKSARGVRRMLLAAAIATGLLAAPGQAFGATAWLSPADLSAPGKDAANPSVAMDEAGNTIAVWQRKVIVSNSIQASIRNAGEPFGAPVDLAANGKDPVIAMTPSGLAVAAWWHFANPPGVYVLQVSTRPPGGAFSAPVDVTTLPTGVIGGRASLAIGPGGDVALAWVNRMEPEPTQEEEENEETPSSVRLVEASVRPAGGGFSSPQVVSPFPLVASQDATSPEVAVSSAGDAIVVWAYEDGTDAVIQASARTPGGEFSPPEQVSESGGNAGAPDVAVDAAGNSTAVWSRSDGEDIEAQASSRPPGGEFDSPQDLSPAGSEAAAPKIAMAPNGRATAVWILFEVVGHVAQAATREPGAPFGPPDDLSKPGEEPSSPAIAMNAAGDTLAAWSGESGVSQVLRAATRSPGGGFSSPADVSAPSSALFPDVAIDAAGNASAIWNRGDGANRIVQAAGYDASPPQVRALSVPSVGAVGEPIAFSGVPFDVWPIASAAFDFGDGAGAPGSAVSHVYSAPGTYPVAFTVTDGAGNSVSAAAAISVSPSYRFRIGKRKRVKRRGIMLLGVDVSGPGRVFVNGRLVKRRVRSAASAKRVWIPVIARGKALKRLRKRGKSRVAAFVSFRPNGGTRAARRRLVLVLVQKPVRGKSKRRRTSR